MTIETNDNVQKIQEAIRREQDAIIAAERERTQRDEERKKGKPAPKIITPERDMVGCTVVNAFNITAPDCPSDICIDGRKGRSMGTILMEGYYTIDDLKKYISLIEKYA